MVLNPLLRFEYCEWKVKRIPEGRCKYCYRQKQEIDKGKERTKEEVGGLNGQKGMVWLQGPLAFRIQPVFRQNLCDQDPRHPYFDWSDQRQSCGDHPGWPEDLGWQHVLEEDQVAGGGRRRQILQNLLLWTGHDQRQTLLVHPQVAFPHQHLCWCQDTRWLCDESVRECLHQETTRIVHQDLLCW